MILKGQEAMMKDLEEFYIQLGSSLIITLNKSN